MHSLEDFNWMALPQRSYGGTEGAHPPKWYRPLKCLKKLISLAPGRLVRNVESKQATRGSRTDGGGAWIRSGNACNNCQVRRASHSEELNGYLIITYKQLRFLLAMLIGCTQCPIKNMTLKSLYHRSCTMIDFILNSCSPVILLCASKYLYSI